MSRPLEFRLWNNHFKQYVMNNNDEFFIRGDGKSTAAHCFHRLSGFSELEEVTGDEGNFIIEQYTGFKDKNGRKIYEGDIVKVPVHRDGDIVVGYKYCSIDFGVIPDGEGYYHMYFMCWRLGKCESLADSYVSKTCELNANDNARDIEVVGNIHENPELLEEKELK